MGLKLNLLNSQYMTSNRKALFRFSIYTQVPHQFIKTPFNISTALFSKAKLMNDFLIIVGSTFFYSFLAPFGKFKDVELFINILTVQRGEIYELAKTCEIQAD